MSSRNRPPSPTTFRIRPAAVAVMVVVLAIFVTGLVKGGALGAALVGVLAVLAGAWLAARWNSLDARVRLIRLGAVILTAAIAVSLLARR